MSIIKLNNVSKNTLTVQQPYVTSLLTSRQENLFILLDRLELVSRPLLSCSTMN